MRPHTTSRHQPVSSSDWIRRCAEQLHRADPALAVYEAVDVAREMYAFERTGAMAPEKAVEFVVSQLATSSPRFERRGPNRLSTIRAKS